MARLCMRTGCDHLAEAQLSYDPVNCHAWIDVLLPEPGPAQELCGLHAANLKVPQGWEYDDRRQSAAAASPAAPSPAAVQLVEPEPEPLPVKTEPKPARAKAKGRPKHSLLSRALKTTGPQRSALSEELGASSSTDSSSTDSSSTDSSSSN